MSAPFELRWGIIATGGISTTFTTDLIRDPTDRKATDIKHTVKAVGSRSKSSADSFIQKNLPTELQSSCTGGTYEDVYNNPEVDVVYIGTPHTYHYENCIDALRAGKHVLCEKPFTFDLAELDEIIALAKEKNLFLMEAVWTRFHPIAYQLQDLLFGGSLGKVKRVFADLSFDIKPDERDPETDRMIAPSLGGGGLLDLGPYPMVWAMLILHQNPLNAAKPPTQVTGQMTIYDRTGVDDSANWVVEWKGVGSAICTTSLSVQMGTDKCVVVQLEKAEVSIDFPTFRPEGYTIKRKPASREETSENADKLQEEVVSVPIPESQGRGMNYQADEVARCIRDGKKESERCNLDESRIVMDIFDRVREQGKYLGGGAKGKAGTK